MVPFDLDPEESIPGIGFPTGPAELPENRETIDAP
jgi:hypothetical protein